MPFLEFIHLWKRRQEFHAQIFQIERTRGLQWDKHPVCTENSNSNIMVMQSAKDRVGMDTSSSLNWARERRVLI
jgi:predicted neuraminidase